MKKLGLKDMTNKDENNDPIVINNVSEDTQNDAISLKAIDELLNVKKLKTISRIKIEQISNLTKLYMFASSFKSNYMRDLADNILQLQISLNGLGRKELVQLVQRRNDSYIETKKLTSKDIFR